MNYTINYISGNYFSKIVHSNLLIYFIKQVQLTSVIILINYDGGDKCDDRGRRLTLQGAYIISEHSYNSNLLIASNTQPCKISSIFKHSDKV